MEDNNNILDAEVVETETTTKKVNHLEKIEEKRKQFWETYIKQKKMNNAVLIPSMIASVLIFVILSNSYFIALILVSIIMVALFIYTNKVKKKVDALLKDYSTTYYTHFNEYSLEREEITDLEYNPDEKIEKKEFANAGFILDVTTTNSRNVVKGKMLGNTFKVSDLVAKVMVNKAETTCFLGKFFTINNTSDTEYKTIIYIKPKDDNGSGPNDIGGLEERKDLGLSNRIIVWSNNPEVKKMFSKKLINILESIETDKDLVDVAISILGDKINIALSYENELLILPSSEPQNVNVIEHYKNDVTKVVSVIKELTK